MFTWTEHVCGREDAVMSDFIIRIKPVYLSAFLFLYKITAANLYHIVRVRLLTLTLSEKLLLY